MWKNTEHSYGWITIAMHWLTAFIVVGLFVLGWWMLTLTYYDEWYRLGPWWHKSFGIVLLAMSICRVAWKLVNTSPDIEGKKPEIIAAKLGHLLLYVVLFITLISGYMISTADGSSITVFGWFDVPGVSTGLERQEDIAGVIHWYSALSLVVLAAGHGLMAVKHHVLDKRDTLKRMIIPNSTR